MKKSKKTCLKKYGVENPSRTDSFKRLRILNSEFQKKINSLDNIKIIKLIGNDIHLMKCGMEFKFRSKMASKVLICNSICPICEPTKQSFSHLEKELYNFIQEIYSGTISINDRTIIRNPKTKRSFELDIFLPEKKIAIEFNGDVWHANPKIYRAKDYIPANASFAEDIWKKDEFKKKLSEEKNIKFITVWEMGWNKRKK